MTNRMVNEHNK